MFHRSGGPAGTVAHHAAHHHKSAGHHSTGHHGTHEHKHKHKHHKEKKHHHKGKKHHHKGHHAHKGKHGKHHHKSKHGQSHKGKHAAQHHVRAFDETELYELYARDFEDAPLFARWLNDERVARDVEGLSERALHEGDVMAHDVPSVRGSGAIGIGKILKTGAHFFGSLFSREDSEELARSLAEIVARAMDLDELD